MTLLDKPAAAIVGARNASAAACRFSRGLAHDLGVEGIVAVSGLARGIDSAAHDGSLASGTVAVIAGGLDVAYPPENEERQRAIGERGLRVAEMPPGTEPRALHFPLSQPDYRRDGVGDGGGRGGAAFGLADHGEIGDRGWTRGDGGTGIAARSEGAGLQRSDKASHSCTPFTIALSPHPFLL